MKLVLSILIMMIINSCAISDRAFMYYPKSNAPKSISTDAKFLEKAESYGAFYNYHFSSKEFSVKGHFLVATHIIHHQIVILNESGYDYAKIEVPDLKLAKYLNIKITYGDGTVKNVKKSELTDVVVLKEDKSNNSLKYYFYNVPDISPNTLIDYSYEYETPAYDLIERRFWDYDIPIHYIEQKLHTYKRGSYKTSTFNSLPNPSIKVLDYKKESYTFADSNLFPSKKEAKSVSMFYTTPYFIWSIVNEEKGNTNTQWAYLLDYVTPDKRLPRAVRNFSKNVMKDLNLNSKSIGSDILKVLLKEIKIEEELDREYNDLAKMIKEKKTTNYGLFRLFVNILNDHDIEFEFIFGKSYRYRAQNFEHPSFYEISNLYLKVDGQFYNSSDMESSNKYLHYSLYDTDAISFKNDQINTIRLHDASIVDHQINFDIKLNFNENLNHSISVNEKQSGVLAYNFDQGRTDAKKEESELKEFFQEHINSIYSNMSLAEHNYSYDEEKVELNLDMEIDVKDYVQDLGDEKIIQFGQFIPNKFSDLLDLSDRENAFDFNIKHQYNVNFKMEIPEGFKAELPDLTEVKSNNEYFKQDYTVKRVENSIVVNYKSSIKQRIIPVEFKDIVEKFVQNIVKIKSSKLLISKK